MEQYIPKSVLVAEIENIKSIEFNEGTPSDNYACMALDMVIETLDTLEVKEVDLETDVEREYVNCYIDIFDKKFPIMPTLKGQYLHDYKNFLNTCQQVFGLKWWGMHPTQAILFEKLSLLWATWGAEHLQIGQAHGEFDTPKVKEVDLEEKATQLSQKYFPDEENIWARSNIEAQRCKSACIEIVEWFKAQKGE